MHIYFPITNRRFLHDNVDKLCCTYMYRAYLRLVLTLNYDVPFVVHVIHGSRRHLRRSHVPRSLGKRYVYIEYKVDSNVV